MKKPGGSMRFSFKDFDAERRLKSAEAIAKTAGAFSHGAFQKGRFYCGRDAIGPCRGERTNKKAPC